MSIYEKGMKMLRSKKGRIYGSNDNYGIIYHNQDYLS